MSAPSWSPGTRRISKANFTALDNAARDTHLISAAPDLYAVIDYAVDNPDFDSEKFDSMARAALAKARGES